MVERGEGGRPRDGTPESEDRAVTGVPINVTARISVAPSYAAPEVVGRLKEDIIPRCFADATPGRPISQSEVLSRINATAGVRSACIVRFCRSGSESCESGPRDRIDVDTNECVRLGHLEVEVE